MNTKILNLISIVHDNYEHIEQLETLITLLEDKYPNECMIAKTTYNSHYNYKFMCSPEYQNPDNHIDNIHSLGNNHYKQTKRHNPLKH